MKLLQLLKLSHAECVARRKTIAFSIVAASVPFVVVLMISLIWRGVGEIFLEYSSRPTDGAVYMVLEAAKDADILKFVGENRGELVGEVTEEMAEKYETPTELLAEMAGISPEKAAMAPGEVLIEEREWYEMTQMKPIDLALTSIYGYYPPYRDRIETLRAALTVDRVVLVKFPTLEDAYNYKKALAEYNVHTSHDISSDEAFTNSFDIYRTFMRGSSLPLIIGLVIAGIIMIGTYVYLLDQELHAMVVYRALGASVKDLLIIAVGYLVEIGIIMAAFVIVASAIGVVIFSGMNAGHLGGLLEEYYKISGPKTMLLGWNWDIAWVALTILVAVPVSLLLTLDQFSVKRLSQKLKRD